MKERKPFNIFAQGGNRGFSIVASIVAAGMIGGLALVLANIIRQQQTMEKVLDTNFEVNSMFNYITEVLKDKKACLFTLRPNMPVTNGRSIDYIKNQGTGIIFNTTDVYGNGLLKIASMTLQNVRISGGSGEVDLKIIFEKQSRAIKGYNKVSRVVPLSVEVNGSNLLVQCRHAIDEFPEIVKGALMDPSIALVNNKIAVARERFCVGLGGVYDSSAQSCTFPTPAPPSSPGDPDIPFPVPPLVLPVRIFPPVTYPSGTRDCEKHDFICSPSSTSATNSCPSFGAFRTLRAGFPTYDDTQGCFREDIAHPQRTAVSRVSCREAKEACKLKADPGLASQPPDGLSTTEETTILPVGYKQGIIEIDDQCYLSAPNTYVSRCRLRIRGYNWRCEYSCSQP